MTSEELARDPMLERAKEVADELLGSCQSLQKVATEFEMKNAAFCAALDERVLECECCGWRFDADEIDDGECYDCRH